MSRDAENNKRASGRIHRYSANSAVSESTQEPSV